MSRSRKKLGKGPPRPSAPPPPGGAARAVLASARPAPSPGSGPSRRALLCVSDADVALTSGRIWRLAQRLQELGGLSVEVLTHVEAHAQAARDLGLAARVQPFAPGTHPLPFPDMQGLIDEAIRLIQGIEIPGIGVPLWKVTIPDDFRGYLPNLGAVPPEEIEADVVIVPFSSVFSSSSSGSGLQAWVVGSARRQGIPIVGLEVLPLGNKQAMGVWPCSTYAVRTPASRRWLISRLGIPPEVVTVLPLEEATLAGPYEDPFAAAFRDQEAAMRRILNAPIERPVIALLHHVSFMGETRRILQGLAEIGDQVSVVLVVDSAVVRGTDTEPELVLKAYAREIQRLPWFTVTDRLGRGLALMLADCLVSCVVGDTLDAAVLRGKPGVVCQLMGEEGWLGSHLRLEPDPLAVVGQIRAWLEGGELRRVRLDRICRDLIGQGRAQVHG